MSKLINALCPNCNSASVKTFYEAKNVPVNSCLLFSSSDKAINFPKGNVILGFCSNCGFITNMAFNPKIVDYSSLAPEEQGSSDTFNKFIDSLANRLIETYNIRNKEILEIGCGRGDFLALLCRLGNNKGVGIDPSTITGDLKSPLSNDLVFIRDFFSAKYADYIGDLVCCRHTLEHISQTSVFVKNLRALIGTNYETINFFEVPDTTRILKEVAFWDIYYEHCSYFTLGSLARLFRLNNFEIEYLSKDYFNQYLLIDSKPTKQLSEKYFDSEETVKTTSKNVLDFSVNSSKKIEKWKTILNTIKEEKKKAIIWGSGSKCVGFMTTLNMVNEVNYIIDINPLRHGKFVSGVGKQIMPPEFLRKYNPDVVIIMNPVYITEIKRDLNNMGITPEIIPCL